MFVSKKEEVTGGWGTVRSEELPNFYSSPYLIRTTKSMRSIWAGHAALMGEMNEKYKILFRQPEGKRSLGRPRRRWEDNIKMDTLVATARRILKWRMKETVSRYGGQLRIF
jgi:hypothetical protein